MGRRGVRWGVGMGAIVVGSVLSGGAFGQVPSSGAALEVAALPIAGTNLVRARAKVIVAAPIDVVRTRVLSFDDYARFMPHYSRSKILGRKKGGEREVYMEVTALGGAARFWARLLVSAARRASGVESYDLSLVEGNLKAFQAAWHLRKIDDARTELSLDLFVEPRLPLPSRLLNTENVRGARKALAAMRTFVEKR